MIQILGLMGMYFDAVVVEVKTFLPLFRLALAILRCALQCVSWAVSAGTSKRTLHLHIDGSVTCPDHSGLVKSTLPT